MRENRWGCVALLLFLTSGCENAEKAKTPLPLPQGYTVLFQDIHFDRYRFDDGATVVGHAKKTLANPYKNRLKMEDAAGVLSVREKAGGRAFALGHAESSAQDKGIKVSKGLVLTMGQGRVLKVPTALMSGLRGHIVGEGPAEIFGEDHRLVSRDGVTAHQDSDEVELPGPIRLEAYRTMPTP